MPSISRHRASIVVALLLTPTAGRVQAQTSQASTDATTTHWSYESGGVRFRVEVVARGFTVPWGLAFLPDGRLLVGDRPTGKLSLVDLKSGASSEIEGVPPVHGKVDGGLLDVVLHPDYRRNGWIYLAYAEETAEGNRNAVDRARLRGLRLVDRERVFTARPAIANGNHFGCRLVLHGGFLFIALGERDKRELAQALDTHYGKILRVHDDGRVPNDNPFAGRAGALPEIWSYGHRNPQGLAVHPETGELWEHEHGPKGGDEINVIRRGANYGWPVITYGQEYKGGPVGSGIVRQEGMEQPLYYYVPSIAPSGLIFYTGRAFPSWRGSLFIGALALRHLNRVTIENGGAEMRLHEERLLEDRAWRIRVVRQGPDGFIYVGVDGGMVLRVRPD